MLRPASRPMLCSSLLARPEEVNVACTASLIGKKTPGALYVHLSAVDQLSAT
jgi:hypothetical protein